MKELYEVSLDFGGQLKIIQIEVLRETEKRYYIGSNSCYRQYINKSELKENISYSRACYICYKEDIKEILDNLLSKSKTSEKNCKKTIIEEQRTQEKILEEIKNIDRE